MNGFPSHKPPNGRQAPLPDTGSNFSIGPGGQASVAAENNTPQPAPAPPNQVPLQVQSVAFPSGPSPIPGQPQQPSLVPQAAPSNVLAPTVSVLTVTPVAPSTAVSPSVALPSTDSLQPLAISASTVLPVSISTSVMLPVSTSVSVSTVLPTSTTAPEDAIEDSSSSSALLETSAAVAAISTSEASEPSQTPSPSASASPSSSSSSGHTPPFYVGIVLGTIVVVALLAALIAWGVRLRTHARRRSESSLDVPWAKPGNNDGVLEEGRHLAFSGSRNLAVDTSALDFSSQDAMAHAHTWEPRGDRDVGEPKRAGSVATARPISPYRQPTPAPDPFSDHSHYPHLADSAAYPLPAYNSPYMATTTRGAAPHMTGTDFDARGSVDDHSSISTLGPLQVANSAPGDASASSSRAPTVLGRNAASGDCGTPREDMAGSRPRFLGLQGEGLRVPWANASASRPGSRRVGSRRSRASGSGNWEHLPPLTPGDSESLREREAAERDGWTAALKSNLMNAFNAVAANLPSGPTMGAQEGYLTPTPSRHADLAGRRRSREWNRFAAGGSDRMARDATISSAAWTLEENGDGSGTVHFRGLEGYGGGDHAFSPQVGRGRSSESISNSLISLQDGSRSDIGTDIHRAPTYDSQTPLIVTNTKKPKSAFLRPDIYSRLSNYGRRAAGAGSVSRASSVYSMASATSSMHLPSGTPVPHPPRIPVLSRHSTMTIDRLGPAASKKDRAGHERPVNVSRLSSSGCSFASFRTDGTTTAMGDYSDNEAVRNAITDRRRRLRRVV